MNKRKLIVIVAVFAVLIGAAAYKLYFNQEKGITGTGTIEVTKADIVPKINGYMSELKVEVGDKVTSGQLIAKISRSDLEAQIAANEAALARAKMQLTDLEKGARDQEIRQAGANLAVAQANYVKTKNDLERYRKLYQEGAISAQQLDVAQSGHDVAYNTLAAVQAQQNLILEGTRPDLIEAQRAEVLRSQAVLEAARVALADTIVASPITGTVLSKNFENGEYVNPGSAIATIGNLNDCWVKVYVSSEDLGHIKLGQQVDVKIDAFPQRTFAGTIKEISQNAEFTPRQSITKRERANLVYYVKVKLDNPEGILKPGMPADVVFR